MLDASIGNTILDGLFGLKNGAIMSFTGDVYIGLLTKLPNINGAAYEDGLYFSEPDDPTYLRLKLNSDSRITKKPFIGGAEAGEPIVVDEDTVIPVYVQNDAIIMFPEASSPYTIVGFGLFRTKDTTSQTLPFLWGEVTSSDDNAAIEVASGEVPVIREGDFKIYFM
jgi:hypothetical protein